MRVILILIIAISMPGCISVQSCRTDELCNLYVSYRTTIDRVEDPDKGTSTTTYREWDAVIPNVSCRPSITEIDNIKKFLEEKHKGGNKTEIKILWFTVLSNK